MVVFGFLGFLFLAMIVYIAMGRLLLGFFPGAHATKVNLFVCAGGAFAGGTASWFLVLFTLERVLNIPTSHAESFEVSLFSFLIGGLLGAIIAAWGLTRSK